jgi:hypothetical protein
MTDDAHGDTVSRSSEVGSVTPSLIPLPQNRQMGARKETAGAQFMAHGPGVELEEAGTGSRVPDEVGAQASSVSQVASSPVPEGSCAAMGTEYALVKGVCSWPHLQCTVDTLSHS